MKKTSTSHNPWKGWSKTVIPLEERKPCNHYFDFVENGECRCKKCGFGLIGVVNLVDGRPM